MRRSDVRFIFRLALAFGTWNVAELLEQMPCTMMDMWMAYYEVEPFGQDRGDIGSAIVASTMANAWRGKGSRSFRPSDFLPTFGPRKEQSTADMQAIFRAAKAGFEQALAAKKGK